MNQFSAGDKLNLSIFAQAGGGAGLAKAPDGRVVLVEGSLAGEEVLARLLQVRKDYFLARTLQVLSPSPQRVRPRCELFGVCGGCDLMHLEYQAQIEAKATWVSEALRKLPDLPEAIPLASPKPWAYRNRLRLQVRPGGVGFFSKSTRDLVPLEQCPVAADEINRILPRLASGLDELNGPQPNWLELLAGSNELFVTAGFKPGAKLSRKHQRDFYLMFTRLGAAGVRFSLGKRLSAWPVSQDNGLPYLSMEGLDLWAFPGLFCQNNFAANQVMVEKVLELAGPGQGGFALDLYCGSGNFTLPLAAKGWQVTGVEGAGAAHAVAKAQAVWNRLEQRTDFISQPVSSALAKLGKEQKSFDLVVLDPPRAGAKGLMPHIVRLNPAKIIYISCHPAALARDASILHGLGYLPGSIHTIDMFPHTGHVEAVLVMNKD
jgi:23S rRNA (uracil1939-C5)-methyltransferase